MKIPELKQTTPILEGVTVSVEGTIVTVKGAHGELTRTFDDPWVTITVEDGAVALSAKNASKNQKRSIATARSQIKNMILGVKNNNEYTLKICSSHFPMQVALEGNTFVVKNFFGEKVPRKTELSKDVEVKIQGDKISVTGPDVEKVGQTAGKIEQSCRITNRDRRIFQDGIYLTSRNGDTI